jgi:hypothetical protein
VVELYLKVLISKPAATRSMRIVRRGEGRGPEAAFGVVKFAEGHIK